jgi:hypothetical protein
LSHENVCEQVNLMSHIFMYKKARPYPSYLDPYPFDDDAYEFMSLVYAEVAVRRRINLCRHARIMHKELE